MPEVHGLEALVGHVLGVLGDLDLGRLGLLFQVAVVALCQGAEEAHDLEQEVSLDLVELEALYLGAEEARDPVD